MSNLFDTTTIRDDAEYWDVLAKRVAANAARESKASGFDWLAQSRASSWLAASLLLVAALAFLVLPTESSSAGRPRADWDQALAPADDVGQAIVLRDAPPAIGALLLRVQVGG